MRQISLVLVLAACKGGDATDTDGQADVCGVEQRLSSGVMVDVWVDNDGTAYAASWPSTRVRAADGTWTDDAPAEGAIQRIDGGGGSVWGISEDAVWERLGDGTWAHRGEPPEAYELVDLSVNGPDDVRVLAVIRGDCDDCYGLYNQAAWLNWNGSEWATEDGPFVSSVFELATLPDGRDVAALGDLRILEDDTVLDAPLDTYRHVSIAADGAIAAIGDTSVVIGTVSGLTENAPPFEVDEWESVWAASATDIWVAGTHWPDGRVPFVTVAHWDGLAWTAVLAEDDAGRLMLGGSGDQLVAVGGYDHEVAFVGGADGLTLDRERWDPGTGGPLAVDATNGTAWMAGAFLSTYDGAWVTDGEVGARFPTSLAVTADRAAFSDADGLHRVEGGTDTVDADVTHAQVAGAGGVLYALHRDGLFSDEGAGWTSLPGEFPSGLLPYAVFADAPDDVWISYESAGGVLAHWDGGTVEVVEEFDEAPQWIGRLSDGALYYTRFEAPGQGEETLQRLVDGVSSPVDAPPDVRKAAMLADGELFVASVAEGETLYWVLSRRGLDGAWEELFTSEYPIELASSGDRVWAAFGDTAWTSDGCE